MLQIIDQRWRDHLAEMDYLREGINLRAMGQQDPLVAWQKEGFDMFGADDGDDRRRLPALRDARPGRSTSRRPRPIWPVRSYQAADDPVMDSSAYAAVRRTAREPRADAAERRRQRRPGAGQQPENGNANRLPGGVANDADHEVLTHRAKIGRNEPCFCGSGKKFKLCHGRS